MPPSGHPDSYYVATANAMAVHPQLAGSVYADVCIIGGGFTGTSAALHLAERGYDVVLLEAARIGAGASGRSGGQVISGQRLSASELEKAFGIERARLLWQLAEEAKATVRERIARHAIACDLKPGGLITAHRPRHARHLERTAEHLANAYDYPHARYVDRAELSEMLATRRYFGGLLDTGACHLHSLNFVLGLADAAVASGARLFERSRVLRIQEARPPVVSTAQGRVEARFVVLAMNGYLGHLVPALAGWIMPINNFMVATAPLGEAAACALIRNDVAVSDTKFVVDYFRLTADHRLLFGGGENYGPGFPEDIRGFVRQYMLRVFPQLADVAIEYGWGGTLAITRSRLPHFSRLAPEIFVAHGYSGQGVALATLAGKLIAEAIAGTTERFDVMADLQLRRFAGGTLLRRPALVAGMLYYGLRDRL
ncbi:MAG TPA: FAD-binding oxidoreductase [Geminicoccaceae bacterium]